MTKPLLEVKNIVKKFDLTKGFFNSIKLVDGKIKREKTYVHAVNDVSFSINKGEVFSIVGESGCGKSTTARNVVRLLEPDSGQIIFEGTDITRLSPQELNPFRQKMQMVFQNPYASLNPRYTIRDIILEPILFHKQANSKKEAEEKLLSILNKVGLNAEQADRFPHQFSGGQRQRISIARALAVNPEFIIADEPVSALDVSVQAQILNLMVDLKEEFNLSYLFIAHDLSVVKHISDRVAVMYLGRIVEVGNKNDIFNKPLHPYTQALFASVPVLGRRGHTIEAMGEMPHGQTKAINGCAFYNRCKYAKDICRESIPALNQYENNHQAACHMIGAE